LVGIGKRRSRRIDSGYLLLADEIANVTSTREENEEREDGDREHRHACEGEKKSRLQRPESAIRRHG
jgi:hypothetical protein